MSKYTDNVKNGLCGVCATLNTNLKNRCDVCLEKEKSRIEFRRAQGLCDHCKNPSKLGITTCAVCYSKKRESQKKARTNPELCKTCHRIKCDGFCFMKARSQKWMGKTRFWKELKKLWDLQGGKCVYTGRVLSRENSQLDHIVPRNKGGLGELSNLQWVHKDVNKLKRDFLETTFLQIINEISRYYPKKVVAAD